MDGSLKYPTLEERLTFLALKPSSQSPPRALQPKPRLFRSSGPNGLSGQNRAAISGGTIVSFTRTVSDTDEQVVLDCDTYLQQYTDDQYDRATQWYEWLQHYTLGLWHLGWRHRRPVMLESKRVTLYEPISDTVLETLKPMVDDAAYATAAQAFEALKSNLKASALLAEKSGSERGRQFLTLPCAYDAEGRLTSSLIHSWYVARINPERFLFLKWSNHDTTLVQHYGTFTLDRQRFSEVEVAMRAKMAERARLYFQRL
jgi:hypothetical protein